MKTTKTVLACVLSVLLFTTSCKKKTDISSEPESEKLTATKGGEWKEGYYFGSLISYQRINGQNIFNGDMIIPDDQISTNAPVVKTEGHGQGANYNGFDYRWPNHKVRYKFASGFTTAQKNVILSAMTEWTNKSGMLFEAVTSGYYLTIQPGSANNCTVGYVSGATMNLSDPSAKGIVVHELGHAIGLHHEQLRADRDSYITVKWDNIYTSSQASYNKLTGMDYGGTTFDIASIMLYGSYNGYGAINSNLPTTTKLDGTTWIDNSWSGTKAPSTKDASWVKTVYGI